MSFLPRGEDWVVTRQSAGSRLVKPLADRRTPGGGQRFAAGDVGGEARMFLDQFDPSSRRSTVTISRSPALNLPSPVGTPSRRESWPS